MRPIYLDHNATTPVDPDVLNAMLPFLQQDFGNPSSSYALGKRARDAIETARAQVADLIGAASDEVIFTSGGTESSNIAIRSGAKSSQPRTTIVTTTIEHPATDACCDLLKREGYELRRVKAGPDAVVDPEDFRTLVDLATALVTVIHAQNEIGTLQPIAEISAISKAHGALMHADAAQSAGKVPVDVKKMGVDLLSMAGHKLYAPKGIGALYMRRGINLNSIIVGAGQEHGRRPGTENVAGIVALGEACRLAAGRLDAGAKHMRELTTALLAKLRAGIPEIMLVGNPDRRLPNTLNVLFPDVSGRTLLELCPRVFASNGSACHADREEASAILTAIGLDPDAALGAVRLSVGRNSTIEDVEIAAASLIAAFRLLRQNSGALIPAL